MRKFIISDIHGFGNAYYAMMKYLDNISEHEEIELYINGDLIDRGLESAEILLDIKKRVEDNKYKITYLGGNHELMMHEVFTERRKGLYSSCYSDWVYNGGTVTDEGLKELLKDNNEIFEVANFISNLKIYHKFSETIKDKPIVLVHAACPTHVKNSCNMTIKKDNNNVFLAVWTREFDPFLPYNCPVGNNKYFTIIGHTPVIEATGYYFNPKENYLNIDGGCAEYVSGDYQFDHFPLVEVCDGFLKILTFNSNNEIIYGNYFNGDRSLPYTDRDLEEAKKYLDNDVKIKKTLDLLI